MIDRFIEILQDVNLILQDEQLGVYCDQESVLHDEEIADLLWLAQHINPSALDVDSEQEPEPEAAPAVTVIESNEVLTTPSQPAVSAFLGDQEPEITSETDEPAPETGLPIQVQAAPALPDARALGQSLRPLMRKVPSLTRTVLDEIATVNNIAERDVWLLETKPARERWFDLELVIEASPSTFIWDSTLEDFRRVVERQGAFRNVRTWQLEDAGAKQLRLTARAKTAPSAMGVSSAATSNTNLRNHSHRELVDAAGRRLVFVISDCRSDLWKQGRIHDWLKLWSQHGPTAIVQLLPEWLWQQSELDVGFAVQASSLQPGARNHKLRTHGFTRRKAIAAEQALILPIVTLTPDAMKQWALVVAAAGQQRTPARLFDMAWVQNLQRDRTSFLPTPQSAEERIDLFEATASSIAQQLALTMAAVPVSLEVVHLIQRHVLPQVQPVHVAEVYASGLLRRLPRNKGSHQQEDAQQSRNDRYDFAGGVRELLNERSPIDETVSVLDELSKAIANTLGLPPIDSFTALLSPRSDWTAEQQQALLPFAAVTTQVLHRLGGDYAELAELVEEDARQRADWIGSDKDEVRSEDISGGWPEFKPLEVEVAQLVEMDAWPAFQTEIATVATVTFEDSDLERFEFNTATISKQRQGFLGGLFNRQQQTQWVIKKQEGVAERFVEQLPQRVSLEMVAIPAGRFTMGSPADEPERPDNESPQHEVTLSDFFIGRYPITQAQWRAVAALEPVELELEPTPFNLKGDNRPVANVSWQDATEFCRRLSQQTGRDYRLPTEAEWEYACRAGTTTPFHFGEMITTELANYDGKYSYVDGPKGKNRGGTTDVDEFPANLWGVSDMHGNVLEWCQDHYHDSYKGAPKDGSAWVDESPEKELRILRGGSWIFVPRLCRSAQRDRNDPSLRYFFIGFRVVCTAPRT